MTSLKINRYTHEIDGSGFLDDIKNKVLEKFAIERYPGERHARVVLTGDQGYNSAGPGTNLNLILYLINLYLIHN